MTNVGKNTQNALLLFRVMAVVTGVVLVSGTIALIVEWAGGASQDDFRWLWVLHGFLYIVYLLSVANLGIKLRWPYSRTALVALAGTVPTMSFVAEHFVTRDVKLQLAGGPAPATQSAL